MWLTAADFNRDGRADLAEINSSSSTVSVLLNAGSATDTTPPTVTAMNQQYPDAPNRLTINFSENVASSLSNTDLLVRQILPDGSLGERADVLGCSYDSTTNIAMFTLPPSMPNGNYRATLSAGSVADAAGNPLASDYGFDFFTLAGDANHDRVVDVKDLGILGINWQSSSGMTFAQGDFNYDGMVDISDLGILATSWQKALVAPSQPTTARLRSPVPARSPFASPQLIVDKTRRSLVEEVGLT